MKFLALVGLCALCVVDPSFSQANNEVVASIQRSLDKVGADDWSGPGSVIRKALDALAHKKNLKPETTLVVALGNFTYAQSGLGSPFSRFLEDQFSAALVKSKYFTLFPREILSNLSSGLEDSYRTQIGGEKATGSLAGKFTRASNGSMTVDYQLTDLEKGQVIVYDQITVPKNAIPAGLVIEPQAPPSVPQPAPAVGQLSVSMTTDRGLSAAYFDGEELSLSVFASKDCWLKVYQIDGQGVVKLIFPNQFAANNQIPANKVVWIPSHGSPFAFKMGAPYGVETIRAVVSTSPFQAQETAFENLGSDTANVLSRGISLAVKKGSVETAQTQLQYTVNPAPGR